MANIKHYYNSLKYIINLASYKDSSTSSIKVVESHYNGFNNRKIPLIEILSNNSNKGNIILFPGASPFAEKHPQVIRLGKILSTCGFKVYIPRMPLLKKLEISKENVKWFKCFYKWYLNQDNNDYNKTIAVGISFGGGLLLKMLLESELSECLPKTVLVYGTYFNVNTALKFLLTGEIIINGKIKKITPNEWGIIVMMRNYLNNINLEFETQNIIEAINLKIEQKDDDFKLFVNNMPLHQKEIINSIISGKPNKEVKIIAEKILYNEQHTFKSLSPKNWCEKIKHRIFIMHGSNDSMVPYTESVLLSNKMPNTTLLVSHLYGHKEIESNSNILFKLKEFMKLVTFFAQFFEHYES